MSWLDDLEGQARDRLPRAVFEYYRQGAGEELAAAEASSAWSRLRLRPRVLRDVSQASTACTVLGTEVSSPILVGPTTLQRHADPEGELASARAAAAAGSLIAISSNSGTKFEQLRSVAGPWWLQLYLLRNRSLSEQLIHSALEAGARAIVLTADTPVVGSKRGPAQEIWGLTAESFLLANLDRSQLSQEELDKADDLDFSAIGELARLSRVPIVVKGVLRADDARACAEAGAAAVWVSNHGGRQLSRAISTAAALAEVAGALEGTGVEVYVDGGIRSGEDVLCALALGARAVFLGRPVLWGLAAGGAAAVEELLLTMQAELLEAMKLVGASSCSDLDRELVVAPPQ